MITQKSSTIAVAGATGKQGGAVARALIKRGYKVRAFTRQPGSIPARLLAQLGAEVVYGDLADPASLNKVLESVTAVFGVTTPFGTSVESETVYGCNLIDAARANKVNHFVFSSAAQANLGTGIPHFESKYLIERYLAGAGMSWTVIAPAAFMDDFESGWYRHSLDHGKLQLVMPPKTPLQFICSEDIGEFAALALDHSERFNGQRVDIAGDELTGENLAKLFSKAYGQTIAYEEVPLERAEAYSPDLASMFGYFQKVGLHIDISALHKTYPEIVFHSFASWIAERCWQPD
ncbi:MAG TPA: NmrA/HSCARG family protein [Chloroflexia bacterium]|nr:NmrA/HSCARG family protein [Chloroflexia bacterium]